ncbi:MAG TPA: hypothetical protein VND80_12550 [Steroidobacteraceae bacterium]|nr:hypothetical protein [Steroidobacteraceae bacterium]
MKKILYIAALLAGPAAWAGNLGVSISINHPGIYGQINLGNVPAPQLIYARPVVIARPAYAVPMPAPIYLHVPPGYERHWRQHCEEYRACGRPVYFVRDRWYRDVYTPARRDYDARERRDREDRGEHRGWRRPDRRDHGRGRDHRDRRDRRDHRDDRHGDDGGGGR